MIRAGELVAGRFRVEHVAGEGGMGIVYRAFDERGQRATALKVTSARDDENTRRLAREAQLLAQLQHPGVVGYVASGSTPDGMYLAMEWLEGEDLGDRLRRAPLSLEDARALGLRLAEALAAAHGAGMVHRDLKPSNIWLVDGDPRAPKLLDFGIAHLDDGWTRSGVVVGTPGYMAPEQARGSTAIDGRADLFALGCVLFECVAGRPAFTAESPLGLLAKLLFDEPPRLEEVAPHAPRALVAAVRRLMARSPENRFADARELAEVLRSPRSRATPAPGEPPRYAERGLSRQEQRLVCSVVARPAAAAALDVTIASRPTDLSALRAAAQGGELERLADGTVIAAFVADSGAATDLAARAAHCALELRAALPGARLAITTGRSTDAERLPLGDAIARNEELLSTAEPGAIVVDELVGVLVGHRFAIHDGCLERALLGVSAPRRLLGRPSPFVGRERELGAIDAAIAEAFADRAAHVALITAPAGAGKSRLLHELLEHAAVPRDRAWIARGDPMTAGAPLGLLAQLVRAGLRLDAGIDATRVAAVIEETIARRVPGDAGSALAAFIAELAGARVDTDDPAVRAAREDPRLMADQLRRAWEQWLLAVTEDAPLLLVVDDLHWGDLPTVDALDSTLRRLRDRPLFVLGLARPEVEQAFPGLWSARGVEHIRLRPLSTRACRRMAAEVLGEDVDALDALVAQAEGNALYLEELLRARAAGERGAPSVQAMLEARIGALSAAQRRVLRAASVFGDAFWERGVARLLGEGAQPIASSELAGALRQLERHEWIAERPSRLPGERELAFRHDLVREAAYATLTADDRRVGHALAAAWLENGREPQALVIAEHWERGGEPARAARAFLAAARQALHRNDLQGAIDRAARGAASAEPDVLADLELVRAEAHAWRAELADACRHGLAALELLDEAEPCWPHAVHLVMWASSMGDRAEDMTAWAERLARRRAAVDLSGALGLAHGAVLCFQRHNGELGDALLRQIDLGMAGRPGSPLLDGVIATARAARYTRIPDHARALDEVRRAIRCFEEIGDERQRALATNNLVSQQVDLGLFADAAAAAEQLLERTRDLGVDYVDGTLSANLALAWLGSGALDDAIATLEAGVRAFSAAGRIDAATYMGARLALALWEAGDLERARAEAAAIAEGVDDRVQRPVRALAQAVCARCALAAGADALGWARRAVDELAAHGGDPEVDMLVAGTLVAALRAAGRDADAAAALAAAERLLEAQVGSVTDDALAATLRATLRARLHDGTFGPRQVA